MTPHQNSGKTGSIARRYSKVPTSRTQSVRSQISEERILDENFAPRKNVHKLKHTDKATFCSPIEARATPAPTSKSPEEREFVVDSGASTHMQSRRIGARTGWNSAEIQEPHKGGNGQWRSANTRGSTGICSRSWSLRDGAHTRWRACSSITWKALRRTQIYLWVCQRSKATLDQARENILGKTENFVPLVVPGLSSNSGTSLCSTSPAQDSSTRYAAEVQDLGNSMDSILLVQKPKLLRRRKRVYKSSWSPIGILKVIYTDNSLEFGKACEDLSWNHCSSTPHRSETNGIAERAVRRVNEGTSAVLLQSGLNENWWAGSMECYTYTSTGNWSSFFFFLIWRG